MFKDKKILKVFLIILAGIIVAGLIAYYFFYIKKQKEGSTVLTEQQRIDILKKLGDESNSSSVSTKEKQKVLKNLNKDSTPDKNLTEIERLKILNSLKQ